jgi:hypothetical protein
MLGGEKRPVAASRAPSGRRLALLWPEENPGSDRIVDQLMFIPPKGKLAFHLLIEFSLIWCNPRNKLAFKKFINFRRQNINFNYPVDFFHFFLANKWSLAWIFFPSQMKRNRPDFVWLGWEILSRWLGYFGQLAWKFGLGGLD